MRDPHTSPVSKRIIELTVRNHPGVMVHVASLFARRAFNLDGILCGPLADEQESRMLLLVGAEARLDQVIRQLEKLHDVRAVRPRPDLPYSIFDLQALARDDDVMDAGQSIEGT